MTTTRLETFADGIFAIAATLLVLNVEVPELGDKSLAHELAKLWPAYVGYAVSFLTIGIIWVNHHTVLRQLRGIDRTFLFINVCFLLCIAFIPFPTRLLATYVRTDDGEAAAFAYGVTLTATAIFFNLMWRYAIGGGTAAPRRRGPARGRRDHAQLSSWRADVRGRDGCRRVPGGGRRRAVRRNRALLRSVELPCSAATKVFS